jgi:predicted NBD/HSP70 family sugar kinase
MAYMIQISCYTKSNMYLGVDIGGTKTLVALLSDTGVIIESQKFATPKLYPVFLQQLSATVATLSTKEFTACGVGMPGRVNRDKGIAEAFGNLPWRDIPIQRDIMRIVHCPVVVDNDANLAGLSEAILLKKYDSVLYVTISTGIGTGIITHQQIDPEFADSEGGQILLEHKGKLTQWEEFASGRAIVKRFGKRADEITDNKIWKIITRDIAVGLFDLITFIQPDAVVLGGGVLSAFDKFDDLLNADLKKFETPISPIPPIYRAQRPELAVVYGCYDLVKDLHGKVAA